MDDDGEDEEEKEDEEVVKEDHYKGQNDDYLFPRVSRKFSKTYSGRGAKESDSDDSNSDHQDVTGYRSDCRQACYCILS